MKRLGVVIGGGLVVVALGLSLIGGNVFAQSSSSSTATNDAEMRQAYLDAVADELGVSTADLEAAMTAGELAVVDQMSANARERVLNGEGIFPRDGRPGVRIQSRIQDRFEIRMGLRDGSGLADLATFLGITENDLKADLQSGDTLVEIAAANGKSVDELRTFLIQQATDRIDQRLQETSTDTGVDGNTEATPIAAAA